MSPMNRDMIDEITKKFTDEGRIVEAGWQAMRLLVLPPNASEVQVAEMRKAYFSGAQHLFASIMTVIDGDGAEPTATELARVGLIQRELDGFVDELRREVRRRP